MAVMGGNQNFLLEMGEGSQKWGGGQGGDGNFLKSLYIVGRGVLIPLFYGDSPYIAYLLFFKFCIQIYIYTTCCVLIAITFITLKWLNE